MTRAATRKWNDRPVLCELCGIWILRVHIVRHQGTNKHQDAILARQVAATDREAEVFFELVGPDWLRGVERMLYLWARDGVKA